MSKRRDGQKRGIAGRSEKEDVGPVGVPTLTGDLLRGGKVRACVAEPKRGEADDRDRREPGEEREEEDRCEGPGSELRDLPAAS